MLKVFEFQNLLNKIFNYKIFNYKIFNYKILTSPLNSEKNF